MDGFQIALLCFAIFIVGFAVGGGLCWFTIYDDIEAEIKRTQLRELIADVVERQRIAIYMAPEDDLRLGVLRARTLHDVELHMREQLALTPVRS